jgi:putative sigma-54 modulation protein
MVEGVELDLNIQGRNLEITNEIEQHVINRLGVIDRHLPNILRADVELASESTRSQQDRVVAQVTLNVSGSLLRAQQRARNARAAVNAVAQALDRQIQRYKSQVYRSERESRGALEIEVDGGFADQEEHFGADIAEVGRLGVLSRVKRFGMEPMTVEEAALQMQRLDHNFYMFLDAESNQYGVLYLRGDGDFGLIQPEEDSS